MYQPTSPFSRGGARGQRRYRGVLAKVDNSGSVLGVGAEYVFPGWNIFFVFPSGSTRVCRLDLSVLFISRLKVFSDRNTARCMRSLSFGTADRIH